MNYKFYLRKVFDYTFYCVEGIDEWELLALLGFETWTPQLIQTLINGVLATKDSDKEYKYQTEGDQLYIYSNSYAVQFFNLRGGKKEAELKLTHDEFISFLEDFKKFVEANS
ncbi:hypothetical protein [Myroides fluvii]|uniref:hypothetical protein n=1 Tax=Myroides fluvii TaxID=2572594 RepID=UPI00131EA05B|nr:hypothetical protein [Myroides fluvii]